MTYRTGRTLGRTVYEVLGGDPKADRFIGIMDTRQLAEMVVAALNHGQPGVLIEMPTDLTPEQLEVFVEAWHRATGIFPGVRLDPSLIFREDS